ncbi:MAG: hypothetical protein DWH96_06240 [Planctomycetota bacterium]|nr:MAG: hypothetical protein DWH96_06240 [Planctomycetota bacterium]
MEVHLPTILVIELIVFECALTARVSTHPTNLLIRKGRRLLLSKASGGCATTEHSGTSRDHQRAER